MITDKELKDLEFIKEYTYGAQYKRVLKLNNNLELSVSREVREETTKLTATTHVVRYKSQKQPVFDKNDNKTNMHINVDSFKKEHRQDFDISKWDIETFKKLIDSLY